MRIFFRIAMVAAVATAPVSLSAQSPRPIATDVSSEIPVDPLPGAFFVAPAGPGPHPAIILLGGSEGGDGSARNWAPLFVPEGYAVLGLPYYEPSYGGARRFPHLKTAFDSIPIEMVEKARDWLRSRPDVRNDAIAIYGASKGAEMALLAASLIDGFAAVAAIVPSDVVWEGWGPGTEEGASSSFSWRGKALPFVPYIGMSEEIAKFGRPGETPRLRLPHDRGRHANPASAVRARIAVEDIAAPVLVAGGDADNVWNSGEMAQAIAERRAAAGLETVSLIFTDAGHALSGTGKQRAERPYADADLEAQRIVWPVTLRFLAARLKQEGR